MRFVRGFGLLETMLVLVVMAGSVGAGFLYLKFRAASAQSVTQASVLDKADKAIAGFTTRNFRLPCPDTTGNGVENCAGGAQKGWLPYKTLGLEGINASPQLKYIVYRSAANDLAVASNTFSPHDWNGISLHVAASSVGQYPTVNGADLCAAIAQASLAGASAATAHVVDAAGNLRQVGYALAHPGIGDADGDGNIFDGRNINVAAELEAPEKSTLPGSYDDQVFTRSMDELAMMSSCKRVEALAADALALRAGTSAYLDFDGNLTGSLDGLGLARDVANEVNSQKVWGVVFASVATAISALKTIIVVVKSGIAAGKLGVATVTLGAATAALTAASAACAVIVGCIEIPHAAASVAAATVAVTAGTVAIAANVAAYAGLAVATALNVTAVTMAGIALGNNVPNFTDALNNLKNANTAAQAQVTAAQTNLTKAQNDAATASTAQTNSWNGLINYGHAVIDAFNKAPIPTPLPQPVPPAPTPPNGGVLVAGTPAVVPGSVQVVPGSVQPVGGTAMSLTANDGFWTNLQNAAATLQQSIMNVTAAQADLNTANNTVSQTQAAITTIRGQISATQTQMVTASATTNPTLASLQTQLASQQTSLTASQTQLTAAQTDVQNKTTALASASAAQTNAQTAYNTARTAVINAFNQSKAINYSYSYTYSYTYAYVSQNYLITAPGTANCGGTITVGAACGTTPCTCKNPNNSPCGATGQPACTYSAVVQTTAPAVQATSGITYGATTANMNGMPLIGIMIDQWFPMYNLWYGLNSLIAYHQNALNQANSTAAGTQTAYNNLLNIQNGTTPASPATGVWTGADAIVRAADAKGGLQ